MKHNPWEISYAVIEKKNRTLKVPWWKVRLAKTTLSKRLTCSVMYPPAMKTELIETVDE